MERWLFDLRLAARSLHRDRGMTLAAAAMLTLALGLNATVYTVMQAMLFRGLPLVPQSDRIVYLQERYASGVCCISYADFEDWRTQATAFEGLAFVGGQAIALRDGSGPAIDTRAITVSANLFALLGVQPMLGRDFVAADEEPGMPRVALLTHRLWENRFAARADVVGTVFHVNGEFFALLNRCPHEGAPLEKAACVARLTSPEPGVYERSRVGELLRCPWHGWEFDMRNGQSWFDSKRVKVRSYPVAVESGEELAKGPYVAETFPVHVEDSYVIIEV